jgi:hypothetical protein
MLLQPKRQIGGAGQVDIGIRIVQPQQPLRDLHGFFGVHADLLQAYLHIDLQLVDIAYRQTA